MKLVLANNQTDQFVAFHKDIQPAEQLYEYASYSSLLFYFDSVTCTFINLSSGKAAADYDGVYLNGYLHTPELAFSVATVLAHHRIPFVNSELGDAPSLTKLSSYAKLANAGVSIPKTFAGMATGLILAAEANRLKDIVYPCILKRADADRGIDNYILQDWPSVKEKLQQGEEDSIWLIQEFIPNNGYYVATYYHDKLEFGVYRSHIERLDRDATKRHMFKPKGGANASFLTSDEMPKDVAEQSHKAIRAMKREIASVDVVCDHETGRAYVLEVNYNPQIVTVSVYREERIKSFLKGIKKIE